MPRGQKSKLRAQEKRHQIRSETQSLHDAQAPGAQEGESPYCSSLSGDAASISPAAGLPQKLQAAPPTTSAPGVVTHKRSGKGAKSRGEERATPPMAATPTESSEKEILMKKVGMLVRYLLYKYQMNEKVVKAEMLKILHKRFRQQFPEILQMASEWAELLFGLGLKEVKRCSGTYTLVKKSDDCNYESLITDLGSPMYELLIPLLRIIFLNGNCASEEEFLNFNAIYDGNKDTIFSELCKFITKDLMKKKYLVYRHSDPPHFEFLSEPREHTEIRKRKVLELLSKINKTMPCVLPSHYAQVLREKEESVQAKAAASHGTAIPSIPCPRETSNTSAPK